MPTVRVVPRSLTSSYNKNEADFSPKLVGLQFTDGASLFTLGNFQVTTNLDGRTVKDFKLGGEWSEYYSLDNLNISETFSEVLDTNNINIRLNFDKKNVNRYAYFGSFYELTKSSIEQIIQKWKASLFVKTTSSFNNLSTNNVFSFNYDSGNDTATFLVPNTLIVNNFLLETNQKDLYNFVPSNEIYNLLQSYDRYVIWLNGDNEYPIIGFTGVTDDYQYLTVTTKGNPFPSLTGSTFGSFNYHIKPNRDEVEMFFEELTDFEELLLNRLTKPIYTSTFDVPIPTEDGNVSLTKTNLSWPVSDGYNIDINTPSYNKYLEDILTVATNFDLAQTNLISRRFVSESIHEFDTDSYNINYGMKITKMLKIYGREYDEVKKYIDGISFANVVTYNKSDNTSDDLIKTIAKNLGLDVLLTTISNNFDLTQQNDISTQTVFSGYSRSLSAKELDTELWRRLVINAWWLFKSKGTRKVIEFFLNLFKIPECAISLNEYVYLAENKLDLNEVYKQLTEIFDANVDITTYPLDNEGFPKMVDQTVVLNIFNQTDLFSNFGTEQNYFQKSGFWYNGGSDTTDGNNPHIGPYDFGRGYMDSYRCFVKGLSTTGLTTVTTFNNYFNNYNKGTFSFDTTPYYGTAYANTLNNGYVQNVTVNSAGITYIGGNNAPSTSVPGGDTFSMKISFTTGTKDVCDVCNYEYSYNGNGMVYASGEPLMDQQCCVNDGYYWLPSNDTTRCFWCPTPKSICSSADFIALYTPNEITSLAISLGWNVTSSLTPNSFIANIMGSLFTQYGCILLTPSNTVISDRNCCEEVNGGDLVLIGNKNYCVKNNINCNSGKPNNSHVWVINI